MHIQINPHEPTPVYRQIQQQIAAAIADRRIHPGEWLLPRRELASQLAVSPAAVRKAYQELEAAGLCETSAGEPRVANPNLATLNAHGTDLALTLLKRELLTSELQCARALQMRLLPPREVRREGWSVSSRCYPAGVLAGDFYDLLPTDGGGVDVVVADVAGKGLAAGLIMASVKSLLPLAATMGSPGEALAELNDRLFPLLGRRDLVALAWARFQPGRGELQFANAGLPDPYLLDPSGSITPLVVTGDRLPIGARRQVRYSTTHASMAAGERLLMFSDGLPEASDRKGNLLGYGGLVAAIETQSLEVPSAGDEDPGRWLDGLLEQLSRLTGSILEDDWTAVLLEHRAP
jgi:serine phosphatase RsbU (regulator of sigma subunit)